MTSLRIALVVHGRFHIFDLARELIRQGHDVTLFTNYPRRICERFGVPRKRVVSCLTHGIGSRVSWSLVSGKGAALVDRWINKSFGLWAARVVPALGNWDAVACMSGIAEELFRGLDGTDPVRVLMRCSAHIREQRRILAAEELAGGGSVEKPSEWIIAREEREYEIADVIQLNSPFAFNSFLLAQVPPEKLDLIRLGVNVSAFRADPQVIEARLRRITRGQRLRVVCVGNFSRQKGARCWRQMLEATSHAAQFRFVGEINHDAGDIAHALRDRAEFRGKVPQAALPKEYAWGDLFALPTLQDGFSTVVPQALASALPVITTISNGASAIVENGVTGWIVPPDRADLFDERIRRLEANRAELAAAVRHLSEREFSHDWADVARDFVRSVEARRKKVHSGC